MPKLSRERRYLVLAICCLSLFVVGMDVTIVNVALPSIGRDLRAPVSGLQWTVDAYLLVLASLLMLSGSVADRVGRRRVFQLGLALFTLGSLACSLAPGLGWLIAFRALQAVGGSMLNPVAMAIVTNVFTDPAERAKAIGLWGSVFGLSLAVGPVIGGALVDSVGWRGVFWVNAPVTNNAVAGMPRARAGTAAAIASTGRQVGSSLGVAVTGAVLAAGLHGPLAAGFASATRPAWWIVTAMGGCVLALTLATTGRAGQASAARTATLIERADRRAMATTATASPARAA